MQQSPFNHYIIVIKDRLPLLLLVSALIALLIFGVIARMAPEYEVHYSYIVSLVKREPAPDFRFDGFYALQVTDLLAGTIAGWAGTPETIVAAYQQAGVTLPSQDPRQLAKSIRAEKVAPQIVQITVKNASQEIAEIVARGMQEVMKQNIADYQTQNIAAAEFKVTQTNPWTGQTQVSPGIIAIATFFFVLFFSINGVLLYESFKRGI